MLATLNLDKLYAFNIQCIGESHILYSFLSIQSKHYVALDIIPVGICKCEKKSVSCAKRSEIGNKTKKSVSYAVDNSELVIKLSIP
jgi:hypothetical protein